MCRRVAFMSHLSSFRASFLVRPDLFIDIGLDIFGIVVISDTIRLNNVPFGIAGGGRSTPTGIA